MAKPFGVVYLLTNSANGLYYVGQTTDISKRMWKHRTGEDGDIGRAIAEFEWKAFHLDILGSAGDIKSLNNLERLWIILLQPIDPAYGYNLRLGGFNKLISDKTRQRMSEAQKKLTHQYWLGKKRPDNAARNAVVFNTREVRAKRNKTNRMRCQTPEGKRIMSEMGKRSALARLARLAK